MSLIMYYWQQGLGRREGWGSLHWPYFNEHKTMIRGFHRLHSVAHTHYFAVFSGYCGFRGLLAFFAVQASWRSL